MIRRVVILQGVSGSGKSTWTRAQTERHTVFSVDEIFFQPDGSYVWDEARLSEGHRLCLRRFAEHLSAHERGLIPGPETVIVDNTNTRALFMAPYVALARAFDLPVEIISFRAPADVCFARNGGRAPLAVVQEMTQNIANFQMPKYWTADGVTYTIVDTSV